MADTPSDVTTLKVIGAGLGRTGTYSLKVALEELGFAPCYHMSELLQTPEHIPYWEAAARGEPIDWNTIFRGYQATTDWPACVFYEELMQAYPEAKVILTLRDPEKWYESASNTIFYTRIQSARSRVSSILYSALAALNPFMGRAMRITNSLFSNERIGSYHVENKQETIAYFTQHNQNVMQRVPPEKLLVYQVKEGWEPLCAFLGVEVPKDKPFPHLNDRDSFPATKALRSFRNGLAGVAAIVALLAAFLIFRRSRSS